MGAATGMGGGEDASGGGGRDGAGATAGDDASTPKDQDTDPFAGLDTPTVGGDGGAMRKLCMICMDRERGVTIGSSSRDWHYYIT